MHKYVQMTVFLPTLFLKRGVIFVFSFSVARTKYEVDHPWCLSSNGEFLGVLSYNFVTFIST